MRLVFAVTEVGENAAAGDYFTALELGSALQLRFGWQVEYRPKGESWYRLTDVDLLGVMLPEYDLSQIQEHRPDLLTIGWARNWFEHWASLPWLYQYDLVLASSIAGMRHLSEHSGRLAGLLRIATNSQRFPFRAPNRAVQWELVFTGSYWGAPRDLIPALGGLGQRWRVGVFGKNWERVPEIAPLHQGSLPYQDLSALYQQSLLVLDDANHVTKTWGAANSRVFDALAAGCLVITNSQSVSAEVFAGELPVYHSPDHLQQLVAHFLQSPQDRQALASRLRQHVLREHTYAHRARQLEFHLKRLRPEWFAPTPGFH